MPFVNDGPYASFNNTENFVPTKFVTSSNPSTWNDNIETETGSIFLMEVYQSNPSGTPYYCCQSVVVNSSGTGTVSKLGGNGTVNIHKNSQTGNNVIFGFTTSNYTLDTYVRVSPIIGNVKVL